MDELTGTWTTGELTCDQLATAVANGGFTPEQLAANDWDPAAIGCPATFTIRFQNGLLAQFQDGELGWGPGRYRITGADTFAAGDDCDYCVVYQFQLDGDTLRIDVVKDEDPLGAVADHIIQTAIYESAPFARVP